MKKVGVITYHHYYNYGTVLQAYALQKAIESFAGYQAELIDYRSAEEKRLTRWKLVLLRFRRLPVYFLEWKRVKRTWQFASVLSAKNKRFDMFFKENLTQSKQVFHSYEELKRESLDYDILVTGSDQTWSPKIGFYPAMFLEFGSPNSLRVAYAPSIGVSKLSKDESEFLNAHLQAYDAISCRERLGTELLQTIVKGKKVTNVLDPTFLLNPEDWNKIAASPMIKGEYIFCYFIGDRVYYRDIAKRLSEDMGIPLVYIPVSWQDVGKGNTLIPKAGPKEFLGLIRNARLVLTDSFHGTVFSIIYRKSFYSFTKIEGGKGVSDNSRLYDILSKFHLEDRLYDKLETIQFSDVDYSLSEVIIDEERLHSISYLRDALTDHRICSHNECTGCLSCESVCTHDAIKIRKDLMGYLYPQKNLECCVNCGLCEKACPNKNQPIFSNSHISFVATAADNRERQTSSSGGIASAMSRYILNRGGVVYGCTSKDADHICHIRINKVEDVSLLKGSKYVQSDMHGVISSVKEDLRNGLLVLFIGTPCQVAGLKTTLHTPCGNLITVDFVCHGVPSQQLLTDIVSNDYASFSGMKIDFRFKDTEGNSHYGINISDGKGQCHSQEIYPNSRYLAGFLSGMFYRESCYQCHYARSERVSDITLGDYWDWDNNFKEMGKGGLSMIMVNSQNGESILSSLGDFIKKQPISTELLLSRNSQLRHPMPRHGNYDAFRFKYMNKGLSEETIALLDKECRKIKRVLIKDRVISIVKKTTIGRAIIDFVR